MAKQQFYRPDKLPDRESGVYDSEPLLGDTTKSDEAAATSARAGDALDDIDSVLADNDDFRKSLDKDELGKAESQADTPEATSGDDQEQGQLDESNQAFPKGFNNNDKSLGSRLASRFSGMGQAKKLAIGGGTGVGLVTFFIIMFLSFLPLKINHIVNNLKTHFFSTSESAVERRTEFLLSDYIQNKVLPGMGVNGVCAKSTRTIDKSCIAPIEGESKAAKLYRGWRDARLENKLASDYGIEFTRVDTNGSPSFRLTVDGGKSSLDIDGFLHKPGTDLFEAIGTRNDIRSKVREAFANETKWKRVMYRFKVGRLLERKYGVRRCLFFCKTTDKFDDWKDAKTGKVKTNVARSVLSARVLGTRAEATSLILACVISSDCSNFSSTPGADGQRNDAFDQKMNKVLADLQSKLGRESVDDLIKEAQTILDSPSFGKYVLDKIITKFITDEATAKGLSSLIPVVGQINTVAGYINKVFSASRDLKRWIYVANSTAMVGVFTMFISHADELKNGKVDADLVGEMAKSLGPTAGDATHQGQTAESTPLYTSIMGNQSSTATTSLLNILSPSASAAATDTNPNKQFTCRDGNPVPQGKLVCNEESLNTSGFISDLIDALNGPTFAPIKAAVDAWNGTAGQVFDIVNSIAGFLASEVESLPGIKQVVELVGDAAGSIMQDFLSAIADRFIPSPISDNPSGGSTFDNIAGGADVAANDFAQYGTGGARITDQQAADLRNEQQTEAQQEFASKPFLQRMFDKSDSHSMVSQVALSLPSSQTAALQSSFASLVTNPFSSFLKNFGGFFARHSVSAAPLNDPFSMLQSGYARGDAAIYADPNLYTDDYCNKINNDWALGQGAFAGTLQQDTNTGADYHTATNPCKLEEVATGSAGGLFTDEVLTKADLADPGQSTSSSSSGGGTASSCTLSRDQMVSQIFGHEADGLIQFDNAAAEKGDIQDPSKTSDKLVCVIWSILEQGHFHIIIAAINSDHSPGGLHVLGRAVDLGRSDANKPDQPTIFKWLYDNHQTLQIDELIHEPVPPGTNPLDQGKDCPDPTCYGDPNDPGSTANAHFSHIHVGVFP